MDKQKEQLIRHAVAELIEKGNLEILPAVFTEDYVAHAGKKNFKGHAFIRQFEKRLHKAVPDLKVVDLEFLAQDGNTVVWQRTLKGTHKVAMQGIPASQKKLQWVEMLVSRFRRNKIAEEWVVSELMGEMLLRVPPK